jgi:hypothetical protein
MPETALITLLLAGTLLAPAPTPADVTAARNIAPQTFVVASPPRLVAVPGSSVFYAPSEPRPLFVYRGSYYRFHGGTWFRSAGPGHSWSMIATDRAPNAVLAVPTAYSKTPPEQSTARQGKTS